MQHYHCVLLLLLCSSIMLTQAFLAPSLTRYARATLSMLKVGEAAPDFELKNFKGQSFKLSSFKGKKPVVVFFYPADNTPGCTTEVCAFQKRFPDFKAAGAEVFGISSGGSADKEKFITKNQVSSYELLMDSGDVVRNKWQVPKAAFGFLPGRVTYVIGKDGGVKYVFDDLVNAALHPDKALDALKTAK